MSVRLSDLLGDEIVSSERDGTLEITGVCLDSRLVSPGDLFAALPGVQTDGRKFIPMAIERGAVAVLAQTGTQADVPVVQSDDPALSLAKIAARFYPRQPEILVAVTGTNGKSSTVEFLRQIWASAGYEAAALGTLGVTRGADRSNEGRTTPDAISLHENLQALAEDGVTHLAMEASSHGLKQRRMDGVRVKAAGFLNLSQDHLDYHPDFEDYYAAKRGLFDRVAPTSAPFVIVVDNQWSKRLAEELSERGNPILTIGWEGRDLKFETIEPDRAGQVLRFVWQGRTFETHLPLIGAFQASNALAAAALAISVGMDADLAFGALSGLKGVDGRVEHIADTPSGASVYVDYAHTPDGLEQLIKAARPHASGKVHLLFGAGGDRDPDKRAKMGAIAARLADEIIVTDDNPRTENAADIRTAIISACPKARNIAGREQAIGEALKALNSGDLLLIAGKGHETGQTIGDKVLPFDEKQIVTRFIEELRS